ncbi:MAG: flagellar export protein FliJ [Hyphomicrobiaceae bacterium]|jgi:hypothetical protein
MKARDTMLRTKRFDVDERARKVADIESMIRDLETMASDLTRQIAAEEERSGVKDPSHFAYSTFAKAASQRRENLTNTTDKLRLQLDDARRAHEDALSELQKLEASDGMDGTRRGPGPDRPFPVR